MKTIYINESQLPLIREIENSKREVTFEEFLLRTKDLLKNLLTNPSKVEDKNKKFFTEHGININDMTKKLRDKGIINISIEIIEVGDEGKKIAKRKDTYKIPRANFKFKMQALHKEMFGGEKLDEGGEGGASSCGNVMQGGGSNPSAGTFDTAVGTVRKDFWHPAQTRNEDEDNGSISMNRQK